MKLQQNSFSSLGDVIGALNEEANKAALDLAERDVLLRTALKQLITMQLTVSRMKSRLMKANVLEND